MPCLVPVVAVDSPALSGLRRSVWQLAVLGIATAALFAHIAPQQHAAATWSALIPLIALATMYRRELLDLIRAHRAVAAPANARRRSAVRKQPQARRSTSGRASTKSQQIRTQPATG